MTNTVWQCTLCKLWTDNDVDNDRYEKSDDSQRDGCDIIEMMI